MMNLKSLLILAAVLPSAHTSAQAATNVTDWQMQEISKTSPDGAKVSLASFHVDGWYRATVPGTVLTTLVDNKVYPEPLYGENMRNIPESLNKTSYWYRTQITVPKAYAGRHTWLHFGGINYSAEIWVNGHPMGQMRGAFIRGDFDISKVVKPGSDATLAVLVSPQPHPGIPHEHTVATGEGKNGGETAIDGPTFLSTIGWDWLPAIRDRDTGIWQPVTLSASGPVLVKDPYIVTDLAASHESADLTINTQLANTSSTAVKGVLVGTITGGPAPLTFRKAVTVPRSGSQTVKLDPSEIPELHLRNPHLWWPNGYGPQNLYKLTLHYDIAGKVSESQTVQFGLRKIEYDVPETDNLTISVNGVRVMVRGGNWGLDEGMKRIPRERIEAQFHMHALANLNFIRNWVGQSTAPDFYDMADKYGILLWDEFFQPNPSDGPNPTDVPTYLANVSDKVLRYRNHPSIAVWCARNEGFPPKELDNQLKARMQQLDPGRHYQSSSTDGRGVHSGGPYYWRVPTAFYKFSESFKTEVGSVSVPTIESIQGMMPEKDWETINDDWAQHDMAKGAQHGNEYPGIIAKRYGEVRNLADFVRKSQLANYEAFRAMYEGRNAKMFQTTSGVITWMSHPAQPSFVWQLYHYDLEPNASLFAVRKAAEHIHVQLNEATNQLEVVNNDAKGLADLTISEEIFDVSGKKMAEKKVPVENVAPSSTADVGALYLPDGYTGIYFVHLILSDTKGAALSTNFYWQSTNDEGFAGLAALPAASLKMNARLTKRGENSVITVDVENESDAVALMAHLQLHRARTGKRVLPVFYSDNYVSLVPGEARAIKIEYSAKDLAGEAPLIAVDGYNVRVEASSGEVAISPNRNADPMESPKSNLIAP